MASRKNRREQERRRLTSLRARFPGPHRLFPAQAFDNTTAAGPRIFFRGPRAYNRIALLTGEEGVVVRLRHE
jgi:hypothetical protein